MDNKNLAVDFTENSIAPAGDGSLIFTGTGTKRFKFIDVKDGVDNKVYFRIKDPEMQQDLPEVLQ